MSLITRQGKGSKLSIQEMDGNLLYLESLASQSGISLIGGSTITSIPNSASDQSGLTTLRLNPDPSTEDDRYIVLDPTGPNHIHIRPGGVIDQSTADLIIGGEKTFMSISDDSRRVYLKSERNSLIDIFYFATGASPSSYSTATWEYDNGNSAIIINNPDQSIYNATWMLNDPSTLGVSIDGNYYELIIQGTSTPGNPEPIKIFVYQLPPNETTPSNIEWMEFLIRQYRESSIEIDSDVDIRSTDDLRFYAYDIFSLRNYSDNEPISIITNYDGNNELRWEFETNGNLRFPDGTTQNTAAKFLEGTNYTFVFGKGTDVENAAELLSAYTTAKSMSPSDINKITVVVSPGKYNFFSDFIVDTDYVNIVSLDGNRSVIFNGTGTINISNNNIYIKGIDVLNKNFTIPSNANGLTIENCKGGDWSFGGDSTLGNNPVIVNGTFINCEGGYGSFGSYGDAAGTFTNCIGSEDAFGKNGTLSGKLYYCRLLVSTFQTVNGGRTYYCIDGNGNTNNQ